MIDLKKTVLPKEVEVDGIFYKVQTDFHFWLIFLNLVENPNTCANDVDFMYIDKKPTNKLEGIKALINFCNPAQTLPRVSDVENSEKAFDYNLDSDYIYSAFYEVYKIDLLESTMHWYKFLALLKGLHDTKFNEIVGYRLFEAVGKKDEYTKQMLKLKRAWELPAEKAKGDKELIEFESLLYS